MTYKLQTKSASVITSGSIDKLHDTGKDASAKHGKVTITMGKYVWTFRAGELQNIRRKEADTASGTLTLYPAKNIMVQYKDKGRDENGYTRTYERIVKECTKKSDAIQYATRHNLRLIVDCTGDSIQPEAGDQPKKMRSKKEKAGWEVLQKQS